MRISLLVLCVVGALGTVGVFGGCGPQQITVNSTSVVQVQQRVQVAWGSGGQGGEEINFEDPRLVGALANTESVLGRRVDFLFDVTRMPRPRVPFFEAMFDRQVGRIPLELESLAQRDLGLFAFLQQNLQLVTFDYDGARDHREVEYDYHTGTLRFVLTGPDIGRGTMAYVAEEAYRAMLDERFMGRRLAEVEANELPMYASWVAAHRRRGEDVLAPLAELLMVWERVLGEPSAQDKALPILREQIPRRASRLRDQYNQRAREAEVSPLLESTARAFAQFVTREFDSLPPRGKAEVLRVLFVRRSNVRDDDDRFVRDVYPGLDRYEFGIRIARQWLAAGAEETFGEGDARDEMTSLICPRGHGERPLDASRCRSDGGLWHFISYDEALRARLVQTLKEVNDPRLTLTALTGLRDSNAQAMVDVWHQLEDSPAHWRIGARVLGDRVHHDRNRDMVRSLYDEAVGAWRRNPSLRSGYLYILAANEFPRSGYAGVVPFDNFARVFGGSIDRTVLSEFLEISEGALLRLPIVWQALARGAGTAVVAPVLQRLLEDGPGIMQRSGFRRMDSVADWLRAMRDARDTAGQSAARSYLTGRLREHPSEERMLEAYLSLTR